MSIIKRHNKIALLIGILVLPLLGASVIHATRLLTKDEEIQLKQQMKPAVPVGERAVDLVGIFAPGFETELASAKTGYEKEYGAGNFQVIDYKGFTLLVPPTKTGDDIARAKQEVDTQIASQKNKTPSAGLQNSQIAKIREVFGTSGSIVYDSFLGAYTDEKGFQYNFENGELVNKQVGVTSSLAAKWAKAYPYLAGDAQVPSSVLSEDQAKTGTDKVIEKAFDADQAKTLKQSVKFTAFDGVRLGIVYGGNYEVKMMVDRVTGDIIHYSKDK